VTSGPDGLLFSRDHLWVRVTDGTARVGLTDFAQETLGDIVDISVPDENDRVTAGQACGDIESTKSVSDLLAPVSGIVTAVNANLDERPELVNTDPYGAGWLIDVRLSPGAGTADLLSATDYAQLIGRGRRTP
jgi:glycine cleavage system H protein